MNGDLTLAFTLLLIGMITVFLILTLVVTGGRILIAVSNRFYKSTRSTPEDEGEQDDVPVAILAAVVHHITGGKGRISGIDKIK